MNKVFKGRALKLLPALFFLIFISWVIYMADVDQKNWLMDLPKLIPYGDKLGHFVLYGIMAALFNFAMSERTATLLKHPISLGSIIVLVFAIGEEFSQMAFDNRTFDILDMVFDAIGVWAFSRLNNYPICRKNII